MPRGILGRKIGMTQYFDDDGSRVGVTVLECPANRVLQVKTGEKDGYSAVQVGIDDKKEKHAGKAESGHAKAGGGPCRFIRELKLDDAEERAVGDAITVESFEEGEKVMIRGVSKGKGFAGVMKRHNFGGFRATHGVKTHHRHAGSIGQCQDPGKVFKGKRMPGQMGNRPVTTKGLRVVKIMADKGLILVRGSVPGANGSYVMVLEDTGYVEPKN